MSLLLSLLLLSAPGAAAASPATTPPAVEREVRSVIGAILRAEGDNARTILRGLPSEALDEKDRQFQGCALSRLDPGMPVTAMVTSPGDAAFVHDLLILYRTYWRDGTVSGAGRAAAERDLLAGLARLLGRPAFKDIEEAEPLIAARLKAAGLFSQEGRTGVLRDLMIWGRETRNVQHVPLPEGGNDTQVNYLDGFISRGWSAYLSCDRTGTGGWTTQDGLFVIVPSYASLTDEHFRVNFLAHESQHFADKRRFGTLPSWRLEYRAKLAELAYADSTRDKVLDAFTSNQGDDAADPHSYANKRVLEAMRRRLALPAAAGLKEVPLDRLHQAAVDQLKADSEALRLAAGR